MYSLFCLPSSSISLSNFILVPMPLCGGQPSCMSAVPMSLCGGQPSCMSAVPMPLCRGQPSCMSAVPMTLCRGEPSCISAVTMPLCRGTLVHEFYNFYGHSESNFLFSFMLKLINSGNWALLSTVYLTWTIRWGYDSSTVEVCGWENSTVVMMTIINS